MLREKLFTCRDIERLVGNLTEEARLEFARRIYSALSEEDKNSFEIRILDACDDIEDFIETTFPLSILYFLLSGKYSLLVELVNDDASLRNKVKRRFFSK